MRKGFLQIVEILIVSLMVFVVMMQFYYMPKSVPDWERTRLSTEANDMLFSLDRKGVNWFNQTEVEGILSSVFPNSTVYSLRVGNVIRPRIEVGCICSTAEATSLRSALRYFELNGQDAAFNVSQIPPSAIAFPHDYDVVVVFDYDLTANYTQVRQFLDAGKGIVEYRHLGSGDIDQVQRDFFGLDWNSSLPNPNTNAVGFSIYESSDNYFNLYKYFHSIPLYRENFTYSIAGWTPTGGTWNWRSQGYNGSSASQATSFYTSGTFDNSYALRVWFMPRSGYSKNVTLILYQPNWQDPQSNVFADFDVSNDVVTIWENVSGTPAYRGSGSAQIVLGRWHDAKIVPLADRTLEVYVNGSKVLTTTPVTTIPASSYIGLGVDSGQARFDNVTVTFSQRHAFGNLLNGEKVQPSSSIRSARTVLIQQGTGVPACIVNSNIIEERGRTAWLAPGAGSSNETDSMLRALVAWAAGEERQVVSNEVRNSPVLTSLYKVYDQDMYQPVEISFVMGYSYQD